jgi:predicted enzyme related to lactoylglutathione lyase
MIRASDILCRESPLEEHLMTRPVVAFRIRGRAAALQEFYKKLFGWQMKTDNPMGVAFIAPGIGGPVEGVGGTLFPGDPRVIIFVQVADLRDSLAKAVTLGGQRIQEPFDVPNGPTVAQIADPEGNVIGLVQQ